MVQPIKGRGTALRPPGRFESRDTARVDDGWGTIEEELPPFKTTVTPERAKSIISRNDSPDIGFDQSINPYKGCEHGCIYCYARPSHAYLNLSPGLDFESKLFYKPNAAELLDRELRKPGYQVRNISLGANTDPYQPIERRLEVTRSILQVLARFRHPVGIITKGSMIERDLDLLMDLARDRLVSVGITLTTLDPELKRTLEPRASSPQARLRVMRKLSAAGIPVRVMFSPVIPCVNDAELERVLEAAAEAGAGTASYVLLRLPYELKELFREWLDAHMPLRAAHVMSLINQSRGGKDYQAEFGSRMRGSGQFAELIARRFALARRRYGLDRSGEASNTAAFRVPPAAGDQMGLF
ncbi:PA0069 family radical SAM protein [Nevskia soli]|uniref:PA0069 family radical SAM protein n=1 Tax=Nevskia soli TaxID=418856 RepID=UPI0004A7783C|nr:PA0069 family radical SAM protein [Nevskia soli]